MAKKKEVEEVDVTADNLPSASVVYLKERLAFLTDLQFTMEREKFLRASDIQNAINQIQKELSTLQ